MKRDPHTDAPNFWAFARDYLHAYLPKARRLSPKTIQAYRISLECFLGYLSEVEHVEREHVAFDHFDRPHLKAWLTWMSEQKGYAPKTIALRLSAIKAFLPTAPRRTSRWLRSARPRKPYRPRPVPANRSSTSPRPKPEPC